MRPKLSFPPLFTLLLGHRLCVSALVVAFSADDAHSKAMSLAGSGDYAGALEHFEHAIVLDPGRPPFWNNLGVTAMRLGRFNEARDAFLRGIAVADVGSTPFADCEENLRVLDAHLTATGANLAANSASSRYATLARTSAEAARRFNAVAAARTPGFTAANSGSDATAAEGDAVSTRQTKKTERRRRRYGNGLTPVSQLQHTVRPLPRIHASQLSSEPAFARYAHGAAPFILTGLPDSPAWRARPASANALSLWSGKGGISRFLRAAFPGAAADYYGGNMGFAAVTPRYTRMAAALDEMDTPLPHSDAHACNDDDDSGGGAQQQRMQQQRMQQQAQRRQAKPRGVITRPGRYLQWNADAAQWARLQQYLGPLPPLFTGDASWLDSGACFMQPPQANSSAGTGGTGYSDAAGSGAHHASQPQPHKDQQQGELLRLRSEFQRWTHWRMLLIGSEGAGMFNHADILHTASWQLQVAGAKTWHLCAPEQGPYMGAAGEVDTLAPDYNASAFFRSADCFRDTVRPGEAIYYPSDWWHQTYNHADADADAVYRESERGSTAGAAAGRHGNGDDDDDDGDGAAATLKTGFSVAITGSVVDASNHRALREELRKEMRQTVPAQRRLILISPALHAALEGTCFPLWEQLYGPWPPLQPRSTAAAATPTPTHPSADAA